MALSMYREPGPFFSYLLLHTLLNILTSHSLINIYMYITYSNYFM